MLDLTGLPALDLAIGLAFIFFLLATLALTIQEFIAAFFGLRARTLEQGLRSMLEDDDKGWKYVDEFYAHPLIRSLYRTPPPAAFESKPPAAKTDKTVDAVAHPLGKNEGTQSRGVFARARAFFERTKGPSYISPRSFALVVLDNLAPAEGKKPTADAALRDALGGLPKELAQRLTPLVAGAEMNVEQRRVSLEAWYDDTMARVSGWYKRKTQIILLVIGVILVPAMNANAIAMAERMWKDDTVRSAVLAQAQANASAAPAASDPAAAGTKLSDAADGVDKVAKVGIPIGWRGAAVPHGAGGVVTALAGWLLTILAISLGAPFWFDLLGRFSRLRSSGKPETPLPAASSGKLNERILTAPQSPTVVLEPPAAPAAGTTGPA